jgi:hypothetical protein
MYNNHASKPYSLIDDQSQFQYINSVAVSQAGTFLISVTARNGDCTLENYSDKFASFYVYTRRSTDQCKTWSDRITTYSAADKGPEYNAEMGQFLPVPAPLGDERKMRIYQFHIYRNSHSSVRFGKIGYTYSEDDGQTWNGPDGPESIYHVDSPDDYDISRCEKGWGWHLMGPGLIMSNGKWILPINISTDPHPLGEIQSEIIFMVSDNILTEPDPARIVFEFFPKPPHGIKSPIVSDPSRTLAQEPQICELSERHLICVFRTGSGRVEFSTSKDYGHTWTTAAPLRHWPDDGPVILNPNCPCPFVKISDGRFVLLHCNNDGTYNGGKDPFDARKNRSPIYVSIGRDIKGKNQPLIFTAPRLLCSIDDFHAEVNHRDLSYGAFIEHAGQYYHFYNALWWFVQVNNVDPALLEFKL